VELPKQLGWVKSGRFLRLFSALLGLAILGAILYNATMVDRVPPTYAIRVSSLSLGGKATTLTAIDVVFNKEVQHDKAEKAFSITPSVAGSFHWQGLTLIWTPSVKLALSTAFHVHMAAGVADLDGNVQTATGDLTFTTVGPPSVAAISPAAGATTVAVGSTIQITFDRLMDTQKVAAGLTVSPAFAYGLAWNGAILTITPAQQLAYATSYTIAIGNPAVDTDGSRLPDYTMTFTTVGIGLHVTSLIPASNVAGVSISSQIAVVFDGPLDATSVDGAIKITPPVSGSTRVETLPDDQAVATSASASPSGPAGSAAASPGAVESNVLVFTPDTALAAHTTYSVTMNPTVRRTDGEVASQQTWTFTTGEPAVNALNQIAFISGRSGVANVWLMNPDGSNQREVTSELVPVSGFDVSGDGTSIAYAAAGLVKKMSISGDNLQTLTAGGYFEYAPTFTPNGLGLVVGRRAQDGTDLGYWLVPLISGSDSRQLLTDGAPPLGSAEQAHDGLTGKPGESAWASRAAFSQDGTTMLLVRGSDDVLELVNMAGATAPQALGLIGNSPATWLQAGSSFYIAGSTDGGTTWAYWRVASTGVPTLMGRSVGDLDTNGQGLAYLVAAIDGRTHLAYTTAPGGATVLLADDPQYSETSPSFSPDGSTVVFGRVLFSNPTTSAGIWIVKPDGTGLTNLSVDGAYPRWLP
jgi:hypothetical protein